MSAVEDRLSALGITVPEVVPPVASYVPASRTGNLVYTSGQLPFVDGVLMATGLLGKDVDEETAAKCAAQCAVNAIAAIKSLIGDLDKVVRVVKVVGFVASTPDFTKQPVVINGASDLFIQAFGDAGKHIMGTGLLQLGRRRTGARRLLSRSKRRPLGMTQAYFVTGTDTEIGKIAPAFRHLDNVSTPELRKMLP